MKLTTQQQTALAGLFNVVVGIAVLVGLIWVLATQGCSKHDVGDEKNNPAPSSSLAAAQARSVGATWSNLDPASRRWCEVLPTSSMVPYLDSRSILLLETIQGPVRLHDILVIDEGPGRENVCHQVMDLKDRSAYLDGKNNLWPDGWYPLAKAKWRVAGVIYTKGP